MEILARKKKGLGLLYTFTLLMGLILFSLSLLESNKNGVLLLFLSIAALVLIVASAVIVTQYLLTPNNAILYNESENALYVNRNTRIYISEIIDLSYTRATARGIQYKWGTVTIITNEKRYVVRYVANCEAVCKKLIDLKYTRG